MGNASEHQIRPSQDTRWVRLPPKICYPCSRWNEPELRLTRFWAWVSVLLRNTLLFTTRSRQKNKADTQRGATPWCKDDQDQLALVVLTRPTHPLFPSPLRDAVLVAGACWREETEHLFPTARTPAVPWNASFHYCAVKKLFLLIISVYFRSVTHR